MEFELKSDRHPLLQVRQANHCAKLMEVCAISDNVFSGCHYCCLLDLLCGDVCVLKTVMREQYFVTDVGTLFLDIFLAPNVYNYLFSFFLSL